jgi:hypothetical protein
VRSPTVDVLIPVNRNLGQAPRFYAQRVRVAGDVAQGNHTIDHRVPPALGVGGSASVDHGARVSAVSRERIAATRNDHAAFLSWSGHENGIRQRLVVDGPESPRAHDTSRGGGGIAGKSKGAEKKNSHTVKATTPLLERQRIKREDS